MCLHVQGINIAILASMNTSTYACEHIFGKQVKHSGREEIDVTC